MAKTNKKQAPKTTALANAPVVELATTPTVEPVIEPATKPAIQPEIIEEEEVTELEESGMWWYVPSKI